MSHKLTPKEKAQKGGALARALGLKLDAGMNGYVIPSSNIRAAQCVSAEQIFDIAHEAVCKVENNKKGTK